MRTTKKAPNPLHKRYNTADMPPLVAAAFTGQRNELIALLKKNANIEVKDNNGRTPLGLAAYAGEVETLQLLLEAKADIEAKDNDGDTPLLLAASTGSSGTARTLLEAKANTEAKNSKGQTPLALAIQENDKELIQDLLEFGANLTNIIEQERTKANYSGEMSHLMLAIHREDPGLINALLLAENIDVDPTERDEQGRTPLALAIYKEIEDAITPLSRCELTLEIADNHGRTPLAIAAYMGNFEAFDDLLMAGANIKAVDGNTLIALIRQMKYPDRLQDYKRIADTFIRELASLPGSLPSTVPVIMPPTFPSRMTMLSVQSLMEETKVQALPTLEVIEPSTPTTALSITVKTEEEKSQVEQIDKRIKHREKIYSEQELLHLVRERRGKSTAGNNCTFAAAELIHYFKQGEFPTERTVITPSTIFNYEVRCEFADEVKDNQGRVIGARQAIQSTTLLTDKKVLFVNSMPTDFAEYKNCFVLIKKTATKKTLTSWALRYVTDGGLLQTIKVSAIAGLQDLLKGTMTKEIEKEITKILLAYKHTPIDKAPASKPPFGLTHIPYTLKSGQKVDLHHIHSSLKKTCVRYTELSEQLKQEAVKQGGVAFGRIDLGRVGAHLHNTGHQITFYATHSQVFYIDPQCLNKGVGPNPVFTNISENYQFITFETQNKINENMYGIFCFYFVDSFSRPQLKHTASTSAAAVYTANIDESKVSRKRHATDAEPNREAALKHRSEPAASTLALVASRNGSPIYSNANLSHDIETPQIQVAFNSHLNSGAR